MYNIKVIKIKGQNVIVSLHPFHQIKHNTIRIPGSKSYFTVKQAETLYVDVGGDKIALLRSI